MIILVMYLKVRGKKTYISINICVSQIFIEFAISKSSETGCAELTTLLVKVSLKFLTVMSEICHFFCVQKCENFC